MPEPPRVAWAATSLLAGGSTRTSKSPEEPLTREGSAPQGYRPGAPAGKGPRPRVTKEQPQIGAPWLLKTIKQEQPRPGSYTGPTGLEWPQVEGPCHPGSVKQEEPEGLRWPQAEAPSWPRSVKREEGETSWAKYQEN